LKKVALDEEEFGISVEPSVSVAVTLPEPEAKSVEFEINPEPVETPRDEPAQEIAASDVTETIEAPPLEEKTVEVTNPTPSPSESKIPQAKIASAEKPASTATKQLTEEEKRASRAAKFNLPKNDAEVAKEKLAARAERFGTNAAESTMEEKKRVRAERFGLKDGKETKQAAATTDAVCPLIISSFHPLSTLPP
jgi:hypothetical protein